MTERESLRLIAEMIETSRNRVQKGEGNIGIVWGATILTASLLHFGLHQAGNIEAGPYAWLLVNVAAIYTIIFSVRQRRKDSTKTHIDRILDHMWLGFSFCLVFIGLNAASIGYLSFSLIELFYGLVLFVSGAAFRFRPLLIGGVGCWAAATASVFVPYPYHLLIMAACMLCFLIPGWLLNRKAHV